MKITFKNLSNEEKDKIKYLLSLEEKELTSKNINEYLLNLLNWSLEDPKRLPNRDNTTVTEILAELVETEYQCNMFYERYPEAVTELN